MSYPPADAAAASIRKMGSIDNGGELHSTRRKGEGPNSVAGKAASVNIQGQHTNFVHGKRLQVVNYFGKYGGRDLDLPRYVF